MRLSRRSALGLGAAFLGSTLAVRAAPAPLDIAVALNRGPWDASNAPFLLAERKGYFRDAGVSARLSLSKDAEDALHRVASDDYDIGFLDLAVLVRAALERSGPLPLYVFAVFDRSPASVVTWKTSDVTAPRDLVGKRLAAVATDGAYQLFPAYLRAAGMAPDAVTLVMTSLAEREQLMLRREVDGAIGFDSTIAFKLRKGGAAPDAIDITYYADGGLDLASNGLVVSRRLLQTHRDRIAGIVRACARGWRDALAAPAEMLDALAEAAPGFDRALESQRFDWIRQRQILTSAVRRDGLGPVDPHRLARAIRVIRAADPGARAVAVDEIWSPAYLPARADRLVRL